MADDVDKANDAIEIINQVQVTHYRRNTGGLFPIGECHHCGEPFDRNDPRLFCDGACATKYERRMKR